MQENKLETPKTESIIPETPAEELAQILEKQKREAVWWESYQSMQSLEDIRHAVEAGFAVSVPDIGVGYKIVTKVKPEFRLLEVKTARLLKRLAEEWFVAITEENVPNAHELSLMISSLARTEEYQKELIEEGYPAAEKSTHTRLGAFDISVNWFKENNPQALAVLDTILQKLDSEEIINWIKEPTIGAYHIAYNPYNKKDY